MQSLDLCIITSSITSCWLAIHSLIKRPSDRWGDNLWLSSFMLFNIPACYFGLLLWPDSIHHFILLHALWPRNSKYDVPGVGGKYSWGLHIGSLRYFSIFFFSRKRLFPLNFLIVLFYLPAVPLSSNLSHFLACICTQKFLCPYVDWWKKKITYYHK